MPTNNAAPKRPRTSYAQEFMKHIRECREKGVDPRFLAEGTSYDLEAILADYIQIKGAEGVAPQVSQTAEEIAMKREIRELRAILKDVRNAVNGMIRERGRNVGLFTQYGKKAKEIILSALSPTAVVGE